MKRVGMGFASSRECQANLIGGIAYCSPGVYAIICTKSGNAYVGSSEDCDKRLAGHRSMLRGQRHGSPMLLAEWNKYGELYFEFKVVERVADPGRLREREQEWINKIGTLNKRKVA